MIKKKLTPKQTTPVSRQVKNRNSVAKQLSVSVMASRWDDDEANDFARELALPFAGDDAE